MNLLFITPANLGPHHLARFQALSEQCNLMVFRAVGSEYVRPWVTDESHSAEYPLLDAEAKPLRAALSLIRAVRSHDPERIVIAGYGSFMLVTLAIVAKAFKRRALLTVVLAATTAGSRRWPKRVLFSLFDEVACVGERAARVATELGKRPDAIKIVGNPVENGHYRSDAPSQNDDRVSKRFLYVGRFSPEKNLSTLVDAYEDYRNLGGDWDLMLVGDGPLAGELARRASHLQGLLLHPWADYHDLPRIYSEAGALLLPSLRETWGLVVNESLAAGTPALISDACGCVPELALGLETPFVFAPTRSGICESLRGFAGLSDDTRFRLQGEAFERVEGMTPTAWAARLLSSSNISN